jgi:DNA-binding IclR family transcriptional regulator
MPDHAKSVRTTRRSFEILRALRELNGARTNDLSEYLDIPPSTVHRHLRTLEELKMVVRDQGQYHVGLAFATLGRHARERKKAYRLAEPLVKDLAEETEERVQLLVEEHGELVYVHRETGRRAVSADSRIGKRMEIHAAASGKAILAAYPVERARTFLEEHELVPVTPNTITDEDEFMAELEAVRERGYAFNREESVEGLHSVAVAIESPAGQPVGALCVTGPSHRLKGDLFTEELPDKLLGSVNELELNLKYS